MVCGLFSSKTNSKNKNPFLIVLFRTSVERSGELKQGTRLPIEDEFQILADRIANAYYRKDTTGTMKEAGLDDYLVLLSIYQTCRYRGISFLKFMLSRERDIDVFCTNPRMRRRQQDIELYPKDFTPQITQLQKRRKKDSGAGPASRSTDN